MKEEAEKLQIIRHKYNFKPVGFRLLAKYFICLHTT